MANPMQNLKASAARSNLLGRKDVAYEVFSKPVDLIHECPRNPRSEKNAGFNPESLQNLADDIKERGLQNAIVVRPHPSIPNAYEIVSGHRRFRAMKLAGIKDIPVRICEDADPEMAMIAENLQREDLTALEFIGIVKTLMKRGLNQREIAAKLHVSQTKVANCCSYLNAPEELQALYQEEPTDLASSPETVTMLVRGFRKNEEMTLAWVRNRVAEQQKITLADARQLNEMIDWNFRKEEEQKAARLAEEKEAKERAKVAPTQRFSPSTSVPPVDADDDSERFAPRYEEDMEEETEAEDEPQETIPHVGDDARAYVDDMPSDTDKPNFRSDWVNISPKSVRMTVKVEGSDKEAVLYPFRLAKTPGMVIVAFEPGKPVFAKLPVTLVRMENGNSIDAY